MNMKQWPGSGLARVATSVSGPPWPARYSQWVPSPSGHWPRLCIDIVDIVDIVDVVDIVDIYLAGILVLALPRVHPLPAEHLIRGAALPAAK